MLLPQNVDFLVGPVGALGLQRQVEVPQDLGEDEAHLCVCETGDEEVLACFIY